MIIVSQNKECIVNTDATHSIEIVEYMAKEKYGIVAFGQDNRSRLGVYADNEYAINVIKEIYEHIAEEKKIFYMP